MRITVPRADFARLLQRVTKVVEARNTIPILACVRVVVDSGTLTATATDLDVEVRGSIPTGDLAAEDAAFCVEARKFADIVGKLPGDSLSLAVEAGQVVVTSGKSRFKVATLPASDFPDLTPRELGAPFKIDLAALFAPVQFAISTEETRYYLNGIYLHNPGSSLAAVATDGHRLSRHTTTTVGDIPGVIVPRKLVGMMPKGEITVEIGVTQIRVTDAAVQITSKLIDGTFPDYERVIPRNNSQVITVDRDALVKAAERIGVVGDPKIHATKLSIAPGQIIATTRGDNDEATEELQADYAGEPFDIGFNGRYLTELLGQLPAGDVRLALEGGGSPALITSPGDDSLTLVLMPRRV